MAGDGTEFSIDLTVSGAGAATSAADALAALASKLGAAETAATAAAEAVKAGEASFAAAETTANKAALAVERIGLAADAQRGKLQQAMDAGDAGAAERAAAKLANLISRQAEAVTKAEAAKAAMLAEASALDELDAAARHATKAHDDISKAFGVAKTKASEATKAMQAAAKPINAGEAAGALGKLGGPLGALGQKAFDTADAFKKMGSSLGSAGPYVAVAVAIVAIATAAAAVTGAVLAGIGAITLWGIKLADTDGALKKQSDRMSASFKRIFGGLNIKPLTDGVTKVVDLFDKGSASANAISSIFNSLFQPIVDAATGAIPMLIAKFIQFEILVMKGMIQLKLIWQEWGDTITTVAKVVGVVLLSAIAVVLVVVGALAANLAILAAGFALVATIVVGVVAGLGYLVSKSVEAGAAIISGIGAAIDWLSGLSLAEIGTALIDGLVAGLKSGGGAVLTAITGIAGGAIDAAKSALGIASPSKVFAEIGGYTAEGMALGIDDGATGVQGSMEAMTSPDAATSGVPAGTVSATGGGTTIHIENLNLHAKTDDPKSFAEAFREHLSGLLAQSGSATPVPT